MKGDIWKGTVSVNMRKGHTVGRGHVEGDSRKGTLGSTGEMCREKSRLERASLKITLCDVR
jgi:hypothetical protein